MFGSAEDERGRLALPDRVVAVDLDVGSGVRLPAGVELGQDHGGVGDIEQRQVPHCPVVIARVGRRAELDTDNEALPDDRADLVGDLHSGEFRQVGECFESHQVALSGVSTGSKSNRISRQVSSAAASSVEWLPALFRICGPSPRRSWPSLRAWTHASTATRFAAAPARLPPRCPAEPPPNCSTESSPNSSTSAGICQTWIPPDATGRTAGIDAHSWSK